MKKTTTTQQLAALVDNKVNGVPQKELGRRLGITQAAVSRRNIIALKNPEIKELLNKHELSEEVLLIKLKEGLNATRVVGYLNNKVEGVQKVSDEFVEVPDYSTRHKYLVTALELHGHLRLKVDHKHNFEDSLLVKFEGLGAEELQAKARELAVAVLGTPGSN